MEGPPEAYHVASEKIGVVKNTLKRMMHVIMPLCCVNALSSFQAGDLTYIEPAKKVRIRPTFSGIGIFNLIRMGHGSTNMATSVTRLGML